MPSLRRCAVLSNRQSRVPQAVGVGEAVNGEVSQADRSRRDVQTHINAGHRKERPQRLPDAVHDEIADVLVAAAERLASSGSSPRAVRR
jgi:hypothetical protein